MTNQTTLRIGIDLGGSKIEIAALDQRGECVLRDRRPTPSGDYEAMLRCVVDMVKAVDQQFLATTEHSVGIATPGALFDGVINNSNSTCLNGKPFLVDLQAALNRPVRMSNDANCFALSEAIDGAAKNEPTVFGVIIGTGTGAGIVFQQNLLTGANGIAGEWGHNPLPWISDQDVPAHTCYCGKTGCIETYLSGPAFARRYNEAANTHLNPQEIVQLAQNGTIVAQQHLSAYQRRLAKSLATVINIFDPDIIVLGGGMSNIESLYETVPRLWLDYVFSPTVKTKLVPAKFGDSSGVRGAAWLWPNRVTRIT